MQPKVMLFDEPTSSLDPELTDEVLGRDARARRDGTTMIVVTHEMGFAREVSDHVMFLHNGVIEEEGPPEQLFGAPRSERLRQFISKHLQLDRHVVSRCAKSSISALLGIPDVLLRGLAINFYVFGVRRSSRLSLGLGAALLRISRAGLLAGSARCMSRSSAMRPTTSWWSGCISCCRS